MFDDMDDVREANEKLGRYFFSEDTMSFFNSKVESDLFGGTYFVTSERMKRSMPKLYTIRMVHPDGDITTKGDFQAYRSVEDAEAAIAEMLWQ